MWSNSFCENLDKLTQGVITPTYFVRQNHVNRQLINRLGLEKSLEGHQGCVNCLEWDERGTRLASGSDDCCLIIWDPFEHKHVFAMNTGHVGNIFSVKFMPNLNEYILVTGAADAKVRVHDISRMETRHVFACHTSRIKRLATTRSEPFLFWSASEDGTVRQFDLRETNQIEGARTRNVLVDLRTSGWFAEAKCLALNPFRAEMLAVGGNDPYVHLYDRRKLTLHSITQLVRARVRHRFAPTSVETSFTDSGSPEVPPDAVRYYVPGHLPSEEAYRNMNVTCVSFSPDGDELLVNLGGDHIYLYSLNHYRAPFTCSQSSRFGTSNAANHGKDMAFDVPDSDHHARLGAHCLYDCPLSTCERSSTNCAVRIYPHCDRCSPLDQAAAQAACLVKARAFVAAVRAYNELISKWPEEPQLYTGRATALLKRGWNGDAYSALLDCRTTLNLTDRVPSGSVSVSTSSNSFNSSACSHNTRARNCVRITALLLSARCLLRLDWILEARVMLNKARQESSLLLKTDQCDQSTPQPMNGVHRPDSSVSERGLEKFFTILETEIRSREIEAERKQRAEAKAQEHNPSKQTDQTDRDAGKSSHAAAPRNPDRFLKPSWTSMVLEEVVRLTSSSQPDQSDAPTISEPAREPVAVDGAPPGSTAAATGSHSSPEAISNAHDSFDLPDDVIWLPSPAESTSSRSASPTPLCSCLSCLTNNNKHENDGETVRCAKASDFTQRFLGHCNKITDIKEANFFGSHGQYIVAGSDCGSIFIWDRPTTNTVRILEADSSTVNCVQPHPSICLLASSGIDSVVRLWSPISEGDAEDSRVIKDHVGAAERNQRRSVTDPLEFVLLNMGYRISGLDAGFTRRRSRRPRAAYGGERQSNPAREMRTRLRDRQRSKSSSDADGDLEVRIEFDTNAMDHEGEGESVASSGEAGNEDYDNPADLDDLPEVRGAVVYTGEPSSSVSIETNGVRQNQVTDINERGGDRSAGPSGSQRVARRGRRNRYQPCPSKVQIGVTDSTSSELTSPSSSTKTKTKRARNELTSSAFQPPIACSVFDDDDDGDHVEEEESSSDSDNPTGTHSSSSNHRTESLTNVNARRGTSSSHTQSVTTPLATLRSVLHTGDHLFLFGATSSADRRPRRRERRSAAGHGVRTEDPDDDENAVPEVPCSMS
ncbi:26S proteasome non-ATPase regulatory subunit 7 [Fasciola hepatica]|uniref:26S proteasome non-ATPase regulatory subunit 7 n=1 Tax=Fasciola hepatica TaxID=6192 RepID=A0A4E0S034_FASHE|nr:26S proteasome non-ATPase regulatory subunit 7 [Fasciola hepatica]